MLIHQLTAAQCEEVLERTVVARLACVRAGQPYIVPISLAFDAEDRSLVSFSTVGRKVEWMRANPSVCVEAEEIVDRLHWTTVLVTGRYQEVAPTRHSQAAADQTAVGFASIMVAPRRRRGSGACAITTLRSSIASSSAR